MGDMTALDWVNPYMSARRQLICGELARLIPSKDTVITSNGAASGKFFEWTGYTQAALESAWKANGFAKNEKGNWERTSGVAVTTSCEALIGKVFNRIEAAGMGKRKGGTTTFSLPGNDFYGREPATTPVGWHWYRERSDTVHPQPGDAFQIGTPVKQGQWQHHHVGIITFWINDALPQWETVEAGQGGPGSGYDSIKRKPLRLVDPVHKTDPKRVIMGWLNIDEHFG
ncbi:hypothetical protein [Roseomonas sp. BN140053]|uniref:hypothetical protein n=1 Tax=Roseomonas sp. BN140053 TaxID=3391898 RepID=UPI0039EA31CD